MDSLFSDGLSDVVAWSVVILVFTIELALNLWNGEGWIALAHLAIVGPLWFAGIILTVIALIRTPWRQSRNRAEGLHE